mmetsp:Transcript_1488/g.3175  ORF Transcript_1488/g.3175 Transcript_1488/m.3175 type:complete len:255 (-) Transcript_1488:428-1192(-)
MMLKNKSQIHTSKARKSTSLPTETVDYLKAWMMSPEHIEHPYPTEKEKAQIMADTGIGLKPLTNWFVNNRKRYWKPRVEARLQKQNAEMKGRGTSTRLTIPNSSDSLSDACQYLGQRASLGPIYSSGAAPRAVSIGSASSLSSESSDGNSFDDDDSMTFITFGSKKVEIIVDLKRTRCVPADNDDEDLHHVATKRARRTKKVTVHNIAHLDSPRPIFIGKDCTQWRSACGNARTGFEHTLPTLEEAALMFGYNK